MIFWIKYESTIPLNDHKTWTLNNMSSEQKPSVNVNFDYLAPTLSAICAGVIHHICNKKEALTYVDFLLIVSPSLPVLLGIVLKMFAFIVNLIANGTQHMNLGFLGTMIQKVNGWLRLDRSNTNKTDSLDENGRIIFYKYTVNIDISKKMTEWQMMKYHIVQHTNMSIDIYISGIIQHFTNILYDRNMCFVNFYHEFMIEGQIVILYFENISNSDKYNIYVASSSKDYVLHQKFVVY